MEKKICIVNNDNKFEAVYYDDHNCPLNMVLIMPDGKTWENEYLLINTDVYISWQDYFNYKGYMVLKATYKNKVIFEKQKISNIQIVIDTLNRFNNISLNELEKLLIKTQEKEKSDLELSIEKLKSEKNILQKQINICKEIQNKKNEIIKLLNEFDFEV
jgi:hypothetical protein